MLPLMLMSCSYRSVQCMALLRGRRPDLMDLGHILLNLFDPTPAPHHLNPCHYSTKTDLQCCKKFLAGLNFVMWFTHSTFPLSFFTFCFILFQRISRWRSASLLMITIIFVINWLYLGKQMEGKVRREIKKGTQMNSLEGGRKQMVDEIH